MCSAQLHYLTLTHTHARTHTDSLLVKAAVNLVLWLQPVGNIWLHFIFSALMKSRPEDSSWILLPRKSMLGKSWLTTARPRAYCWYTKTHAHTKVSLHQSGRFNDYIPSVIPDFNLILTINSDTNVKNAAALHSDADKFTSSFMTTMFASCFSPGFQTRLSLLQAQATTQNLLALRGVLSGCKLTSAER